ncbi:hypothetical protein [Chloroflexus sp.]|uniref:hypothetical protein n=1 Tax=Chloroflexus sp. TaxID=1904827 RepID=UPI002ACDE8C9|nr:hypothetical protein [Chloroflexus sp.]
MRDPILGAAMITAEQLIPYRTTSIDYTETDRLKEVYTRLRSERCPFYLTAAEFDAILSWKLHGQYGRQAGIRPANIEDVIRIVTGAALSVSHPDEDDEVELWLGILGSLRGVGVPVASAILALVFPETYAVIDFRGWRQIFGEAKRTFSVADYKRYLRAVKRLAAELGWLVQEVDLAIWEYDRSRGER